MSEGAIDTPTILDAGFEDGHKGMQTLVVEQYTPPANRLIIDPYRDRDQAMAKYVFKILLRHYSGYDWHVSADHAQGICTFHIPDLMGASLKCVLNLHQHPDVPEELVYRSAGLLLERMKLPRGHVTRADIVEAKKRLHTFDFADVGKKRR